MGTFYPNDMLTPTFLTGAIEQRPTTEAIRQGYKGTSWLPFKNVDERRLSWDVMFSENNLGGVYGPKGQAIPGDDVLFSTVFANLIDVKASRSLDPTIIQIIRDAGMPAVYKSGGSSHVVKALQARVRRHLAERLGWSDDAVDSQIEYFALQALQNASIVWPPLDNAGAAISPAMPHWNADMAFTVAFPLPANQNQAVTTLTGYNSRVNASPLSWKNASANPILDLEIINEYMRKTLGVTLRGGKIIMSEVTLSHIAQLSSVIDWIVGSDKTQTGARRFLDQEQVKTFIKTRTGFTIETYDSQWTFRTHVPGTKPTVTRVDFLTEGKIILLPPGGPVGSLATTWQETESGAWVQGKMGWSFRAPKPPYEQEVGVNIVAFPIFEHYDWFILDVYN